MRLMKIPVPGTVKIPVPETVTAAYLVPLATATTVADIKLADRVSTQLGLPAGGRLIVRYDAPADEGFRWAQVESWVDDDLAIVRDIGPELGPLVKAGDAISVETKIIFDWAVWTGGNGAVEGARTECIGYGF